MATMTGTQQNERVRQILKQLSKAYLERHQFTEAYEKLQQLYSLDPEDHDIIRDMAVALIGMKDVSERATTTYQKALELFPDSKALILGLATLFVQKGVASEFSIQICETALEHQPPNEKNIREFLRRYYDSQGDPEKAQQHENALILLESDDRKLQQYLQKLWLEARFDEAQEVLEKAQEENGHPEKRLQLTAITRAYRALYEGSTLDNADDAALLQQAMETLSPARSLEDVQWLTLLKTAMPADPANGQPAKRRHFEEYELILNDLSLDEIFDALQENEEPLPENAPESVLQSLFGEMAVICDSATNGEFSPDRFRGFLLVHFPHASSAGSGTPAQQLFADRLQQLKKSAVFAARDGLLGFVEDPLPAYEMLLDALQKLSAQNADLPAQERRYAHGLLMIPDAPAADDRQFIRTVTELLHHWQIQIQEKLVAPDASALFVHAGSDFIENHRSFFGQYLENGPYRYFPGKEAVYYRIIWENPLDQLNGQAAELRINQFVVRGCLRNHGAYATYDGMNSQLDRPVVVKIIPPEQSLSILKDDEQKNRFFEHLRAIARISNPHIATIFDIGEHQDMLYMIREKVDGRPIHEFELPDEHADQQILGILQSMVRALMAASREGIAHLNLKPSNIWMTEANEIKLMDFHSPGLTADLANTEVLFPAQWRYAAPEILSGEPGDVRSDIYSFGILAYELLTGKHPYDTTVSIKTPRDLYKARIDALKNHKDKHGELWDGLVMKAIQSDAQKRFQQWNEVDLELRKIQIVLMQEELQQSA